MMKMNKTFIIIFSVLVIFGITLGVYFVLFNQSPKIIVKNTTLQSSIHSENILITTESSARNIIINATTPDVPSSVPIYWGTVVDSEVISKELGDDMNPKHNVTSVKEAPEIAKKVMETYGGFPPDAVLTDARTEYLYSHSNTGEILSKEPRFTKVFYERKVNDLIVKGHGADYIALKFGEDDSLISIGKHWRNLTPVNNVSIIPANHVLDQLQQNDTMGRDRILDDPDYQHKNIFINNISLYYYETEEGSTYLEPVWVFWGIIKISDNPRSNPGVTFIVNARKFADFNATNHSVSVSEPITFTDRSQTNAIKWYWEFGDRTNSTSQNPTHAYENKGNYSVNLTVWNPFGKDQISRVNYIAVLPSQSIENRPSVTDDVTITNKEP